MRMTKFYPLMGGLLLAAPLPALAEAPAAPALVQSTLGSYDTEFLFAKITVSDMVRSYRFYTEVIGLKLASPMLKPPAPGDPEKEFVEYPLNFTGSLTQPFLVVIKRRGQSPSPESARLTVVGIKVPDVAAAMARAKAAGATVVREPLPGATTFGMVTDPDGYTVEFIGGGKRS